MQLYFNYIATYATILQLYSQILVSGQMQLYCNLCNYMQLYCNLCNYIATILYATMQHATYATSTTLWNLCNFTQLYATILQLYATTKKRILAR